MGVGTESTAQICGSINLEKGLCSAYVESMSVMCPDSQRTRIPSDPNPPRGSTATRETKYEPFSAPPDGGVPRRAGMGLLFACCSALCLLSPLAALASSNVPTTWLWHLPQPIYWPDRRDSGGDH